MTPEVEERVYDRVERIVLWGEPRDEAFRVMEANGITGESATAMYERAWQERLSLLRGDGLRQLLKGVFIICAAALVYLLFWYGLGRIMRGIFVLCGLGAFWGIWVASDGFVTILLAPRRTGPVTDDG